MLSIKEYINKDGPKPKQFCKNGHEMTETNAVQRYSKDGTKNGRRCRACIQNNTLEYKKKNPDSEYRLQTEKHMKKRYGINSVRDCDRILESQGNKCAICGSSDNVWGKGFQKVWHIDHEHNGRPNYRGIICSGCNHTLGRMGDDLEGIQGFVNYLQTHKPVYEDSPIQLKLFQ